MASQYPYSDEVRKTCSQNGQMNDDSNGKHPPPSSSTSGKRSKPVLVVKKKKNTLKRQRGVGIPVAAPRRGGLPSLRPAILHKVILAQEQQQQQAQQQQQQEEDNDVFALDAEQEAAFQSLPSDTMLVIQTLQRNPQTCLSIPLLNGRTVRAVLECQVQRRLALGQAVSLELHEAMGSDLVKLQATSSPGQQQDGLQALLMMADYEQAVLDALERNKKQQQRQEDEESPYSIATQWLIQHLQGFSKSRISQSDFQKVYDEDPPFMAPLDTKQQPQRQLQLTELLDILQQLQVILPSHHYNSYQLWLPEWGTVLKAWQDAITKLLAQIKRSYYKERSVSSLQAPYSAIPTPVLVEWLLAQGIVEEIQRPSGKFLKIVR